MKIFSVLWEAVEALVFAAAIFVVCYLWLFQPNQVSGGSMFPTFKDKEYILTDKVSYRFGTPARSDVVVFKSPKNPDVDFIKRIIGLPGDTVKLLNGKVYVNNVMLEEPYLPKDFLTPGSLFLREGGSVTVPEGDFFVMGDNRTGSSDSREWGPITKEEIIGKVFFRYFPFDRFGYDPGKVSP
ncbi:MAG: signal peptidase I [bacterium]|nr:signal peptidase I [bacterium]